MNPPRKQHLFTPYLVAILVAGAAILLQSVHRLPISTIDLRFLLLLVLMVTVGARLVIHIPSIRGEITVNDTVIFLTMLVCGGEAAVLMAALSAFCSSLGVTKKTKVHLFNFCGEGVGNAALPAKLKRSDKESSNKKWALVGLVIGVAAIAIHGRGRATVAGAGPWIAAMKR